MSDALETLTASSSGTARKMVTRTGIKHLEFWTAVVILVGTIGSGVGATIQYFKPVRDALETKPLEGVWDMILDYDKFHGETGSWSGKGQALIIWQRSKGRYDIYFGVAIKKSGEPKPILAGFSNGFIAADADGWPPNEFAIENIEWIARVHADGSEPSKAYYEYAGCKCVRSGSKATRITGAFQTSLTNGTVKLVWTSPLN